MSARSDATLAAIVAKIAASGTRWLFEPAAVAPRGGYGRPLTPDTVQRHMRRAGYAVPARDGWLELTPAGLAAVDAVHATRATGDRTAACGQGGAGDGTGMGGTDGHA